MTAVEWLIDEINNIKSSSTKMNGRVQFIEKELNKLLEQAKAIEKEEKHKSTDKYKYCNHHHELTVQHEIVDFGDGEFVANKKAIPLLKALNELGLRTRSHHIADDSQYGWFTILLDNVEIAIVDVYEADADRTKYNGKKELRLTFKSE